MVDRLARCPVCRGEGKPLYDAVPDRLSNTERTWNIIVCARRCMTWLDPMPTIPNLAASYDGPYYTHEAPVVDTASFRKRVEGFTLSSLGYPAPKGGGLPRLLGLIPLVQEVAAGDVLWVTRDAGSELLDVGCGNGAFLSRMSQLGWNVSGVEPDPKARQVAARAGINVVASPDDFVREGRTFDVITMSHVVEHVTNPEATLIQCRELLNPAGRVTIVTPNLNSRGHRLFGRDWMHLDPPRHIHLFSLRALVAVVKKAGLRVKEARSTARSARFAWQMSRQIRREGRIDRTRIARCDVAGGLIYQALEHAFVRECEELVLVAERSQDT